MKSVCSVSLLLQTLAAAAQHSSLAGVHTASSAPGSPAVLEGGQLGRGPLRHAPLSPAPRAPAEAFLLLQPQGGQPLLLEDFWPGLPGHVTLLQAAGHTRLLLCTMTIAPLACSVGTGISSFQDWVCLVASHSQGICTKSGLNLANGVASALLCSGQLLPGGMRDLGKQALFLSACRSLACRGCSVTVSGMIK